MKIVSMLLFVIAIVQSLIIFQLTKNKPFIDTAKNNSSIEKMTKDKLRHFGLDVTKVLVYPEFDQLIYIETSKGQHFYINPNKNFIFIGNLIDLKNNLNLTYLEKKGRPSYITFAEGILHLYDPKKIPKWHLENIESTIKTLQQQKKILRQ
jgi:hypothetical protein